jgi:uncharacterized protein DUF4124
MLAEAMPPSTRYLVTALAVLILVSYAPASAPMYKYVDEQGITHYTDNRDQIPVKYQGKVQTVDPTKIPLTIAPAPPPSPEEKSAAARPFSVSWREQLSGWSLSLPSNYQVGVIFLTLVLVIGMVLIFRVTMKRSSRFVLKAAILVVLVGSGYALYLSSMSHAVAGTSGDSAHRTLTGKDLIEGLHSVGRTTTRFVIDAPLGALGRLGGWIAGEKTTMEATDPLVAIGVVAVVLGLVVFVLYRKRTRWRRRLR